MRNESRPAEAGGACRGNGACPEWLQVLGYGFGAAVVGGYAAGTGYFVYRDLTDDRQSLEYGGAEVGINGAFALLWIGGMANAIGRDSPNETTAYALLAGAHTALAVHGAYRVLERREDFGPISAPS